jgi:hypothetical protein
MLNPMRTEDNQENAQHVDEPLIPSQDPRDAEQAARNEQIEHVDNPNRASSENLAEMPDELPEMRGERAEALPPMLSRLELLTKAIADQPEAPANYVIRGELLLDAEDYALAAQDFETALSLAQPLAESSNWGYINQALIDRARQGLRQCQRSNQKTKREIYGDV